MQPTLTTERLTLRPFKLSDAADVQRLAGDVRVAKTTANIPHPYPDGAAEEWIATHAPAWTEGKGAPFAIIEKSSEQLIGCIGVLGISSLHLRGEAGYWIGFDYWGKGYCTEALKELIRYCFTELQLNKVTSRHIGSNPASGKVMRKAGMQQEGLLRQDFFRGGHFEDTLVYGILRS